MTDPSRSGPPPASPAPGRRERQRASTREAIATAALELFEEKGFAATTIDDIAERADVARRTFFRYFATKEAVLFPAADDYGDELVEVLGRIEPPVAMSQVIDAFAAAAASIEAEAALHRRRMAVVAAADVKVADVAHVALGTFLHARDTIVEHLAQAAGDAEGAGDANEVDDAELALGVSLALFAFAQAFVRWSEDESATSLVDTLEQTCVSIRGLMADQIVLG